MRFSIPKCNVSCTVSTFGQPIVLGIDSKGTQYIRGTWTDFKKGVEGKLELKDPKVAKFVRGKKNKLVEIPYEKVTSFEYGQKAGRRIGATIGWAVTTLGVAALPIMLSKKRKHNFRVGYDDAARANDRSASTDRARTGDRRTKSERVKRPATPQSLRIRGS